MFDGNAATTSFHSCAKLQHATYICRNDEFGRCRRDVIHLRVKYFHREVVLRNVVAAGAAATLIGVRHFFELDTYCTQQFPGCAADVLSVRKVTRILVGGSSFEPPRWRPEAKLVE